MISKARAMVLASFVADSFALGVHWIYDTKEIEGRFGQVQTLLKPDKNSYHTTKGVGEFTHYGDQALVLLQSVAACARFDLDDFAASWRGLFANYRGYFDKATKETVKNFANGSLPKGSGSTSTDLAGAARIAPLVYRYRDNLVELVAAARAQTVMTHNNPLVVAGAEFFARVTHRVLLKTSPVAAMEAVRREAFLESPLAEGVTKGLQSIDRGSREAIATLGQGCDVRGAFPAVVHLIAKYERDLREALIENVMAGGDSAARGMVIGMVLGAHLGLDSMPVEWLSGMKHWEQIVDLLDKIDEGS
jgi:ADP-ribosylglycohydrolase